MEWRWSSEGEDKKKKSKDEAEGSEDGPRESQKEGTPSSTSC